MDILVNGFVVEVDCLFFSWVGDRLVVIASAFPGGDRWCFGEMISALCWVPKGVAKAIADTAEPPTKEEIEELLKSGTLAAR